MAALMRTTLAQIARQLVHARVAAVGEITVARGLIHFRGSFVAVSRRLILVCRGLIAIRSGLIGVGESRSFSERLCRASLARSAKSVELLAVGADVTDGERASGSRPATWAS
jgi:hypothetical protein